MLTANSHHGEENQSASREPDAKNTGNSEEEISTLSSSYAALPSSYRDPAGFVISDRGVAQRVVTEAGLPDYLLYVACGLHDELVKAGLTVDFREQTPPASEPAWKRLLLPEQIPFISYPYEWCYSQLKDAALLTLEIQARALARGMTLKDASAYNVQFRGSRPVFIDTLSFQVNAGSPWAAYEQFCREFLAPLLLMEYKRADANRYLKVDLEGFPLEAASRALPVRSYLNPGALLHIHLHSRAARRSSTGGPSRIMDLRAQLALVHSLRRAVERAPRPRFTRHWTRYQCDLPYYSAAAQRSKERILKRWIRRAHGRLVFDFGCNLGNFSRMAAQEGAYCVAFDSDPACVERLYQEETRRNGSSLLPLVMDLSNPSPGLGFASRGTLGLLERSQADLVLCLALIHHLRFTANLPLVRIAEFLAQAGGRLFVEFVPPEDPAARRLRGNRTGFSDYTETGFLEAFSPYFQILERTPLEDSGRVLFDLVRSA